MGKKMLIDATHAEETRVVVVDGNKVDEFDFESENKRQLAGNIYLAKVTRVEPSLQAAFIDYGGNRHGFLAFSEIHPDYYQIPVADREALIAEEMAYAASLNDDDEPAPKPKRRRRSRSKSKAEATKTEDAVETKEIPESDISGMDVVDPEGDGDALIGTEEAVSPMERVAEAPVEAPQEDAAPDGEDPAAAPQSAESEAEVSAEAEAPKAEAESSDADTTPAPEADSADEEETAEVKDASASDSEIESVAEEDVREEIRQPRKQRPRKYKIQEVIKVRQILLVQVVKEERGNKGAALTTYLSLAGRYCVLMPNTARGGGISRKITNAADRKKLKEIAGEIDVPHGAGLIVRTAGAQRTKAEIRRDYEYLLRLWEQVRELTLQSTAPAKIYEEGDLIKRSIRDLYSKDIDEVHVEGEAGYRVAKDFMKMIMPSHAKNVKQYTDPMPLYARFQVESYLAGMFNPVVQLKSGGYIVIGVTEALVAIDVNSGRATKEGSIEDTALKTNLEAAEEVARQLRLRDLAGLIVIDFIDMEERKNNSAVEKRFKDRLKTDRARIQVGRISGFGLMEMSRQRLRPGMLEATTQPCASCHGTGLVRSDDSLGLTILRQIEEEGTRRRSREVLIKAPVAIVNFLMNQKREHIAQIEARYGMAVRIEGDAHLISPDFTLEKFKTATRVVEASSAAPVVSVDASLMPDIDEVAAEAEGDGAPADGEERPKKRRRRRRRRRGGGGSAEENTSEDQNAASEEGSEGTDAAKGEDTQGDAAAEAVPPADDTEDKPKKRTRSRSRRKKADTAPEPGATEELSEAVVSTDAPAEDAKAAAPDGADEGKADAPKEEKPKRKRAPRKKKTEAASEEPAGKDATADAPEPVKEDAPAPKKRATKKDPEPVLETAASEPAPEEPDKPKRKGWWSGGR